MFKRLGIFWYNISRSVVSPVMVYKVAIGSHEHETIESYKKLHDTYGNNVWTHDRTKKLNKDLVETDKLRTTFHYMFTPHRLMFTKNYYNILMTLILMFFHALIVYGWLVIMVRLATLSVMFPHVSAPIIMLVLFVHMFRRKVKKANR